MSSSPSPLLSLPGAVAGEGADAPSPRTTARSAGSSAPSSGDGFVDLSHRGVLRISGPDRLTYLHSMTTQHLEALTPGQPTEALVLSPQGHVEHHLRGVDDGEVFLAHVEPGTIGSLAEFLDRMRFMMRVEVADVTEDYAVAWRPDQDPIETGKYDLVPRAQLEKYAEAAGPACGLWAFEALRIARGEPRFGVDTDHRTIPNEVGWVGGAVHLDKGCYRGQETVARVHTLGRPPRRLVMLHLDGSENMLPTVGATITLPAADGAGRPIGFVGSSARHHELGPIALGLVKRNVSIEAQLDIEGMPAMQEVLVDPEVGLHVRPRLG